VVICLTLYCKLSYLIVRGVNILKTLKPFVKWAGGKGQLLADIRKKYPKNIDRYCEPFVGGGAVLFDVLKNYFPKEIYISDVNAELINTYITIRDNAEDLMTKLLEIQNAYIPLELDERKKFYYNIRAKFNDLKVNGNKTVNLEKATLFMFLNRTCFNGLFRVNSKGLFNVPMGSYKNPVICDKENIKNVSEKLQSVKIVCGDYRESLKFIDNNTFVYLDPPYRPITETASFTAYSENIFDDKCQRELAEFTKIATSAGALVVISNSDPKNSDENDNFFDELYENFTIDRVSAKRMINCIGEKRSKISELLISNYEVIAI